MRVAMLAPIARRVAPDSDGLRERNIGLLTEGLVDSGLDVTLFATGESQTRARLIAVCPRGHLEDASLAADVWEALHFSEAIARGEEFDLIHNHCGHLPLTYLGGTTTPVLTTLYASPSPRTLPVYRKYRDRVFYASASLELHCEGLELLTMMPWMGFSGGREMMVAEHLRVYETIHQLCRREDHRPWGYYQVLLDEPTQKVKRIVVYPGQRLSLQRHRLRAEHWFVVEGQALVSRGDEEIPLARGQAVDIPRQSWHRIRNSGAENLAFIEVQTGEYFGEDDIERAEDDYGRVGAER
jgi:mannose-6-phosphate isomerase-like protein (cupin superfamily)